MRLSSSIQLSASAALILLSATADPSSAGDKQVDDQSPLMQSSAQSEQRRNKMFDDLKMRNKKWFDKASPDLIREFTEAVELRTVKQNGSGCLLALTRIISAHPDFKPAYTQRGSTFSRMNRIKEALYDLNKALSMDPTDSIALRHRMFCRMQLKQYAAGIQDANDLLKINPYDSDVQRDRAQAYLFLGDKAAAKRDLQVANKQQQFSLKSTAFMAQTPGQQAALLGELNQVLRNNPDAPTFIIRSDVFIRQEKFTDAMSDLNAAKQLHLSQIQTAYVQLNYARCYSGLKRYDLALKSASEAMSMYIKRKDVPGNWGKSRIEEAFLLHSDICFEQRKFEDSVHDCTFYINQFPDRSVGYSKRADSLAALGRSKEATADFERVLKIASDNEHALVSLAQLSEKSQNYAASVDAYTRLIELHPDVSDFYLARARQFKKAGKYADALRDYNNMAVRSATDPVAFEERAQVHAAMGNMSAAKSDIDQAIKVSPEDAPRLARERAKLEHRK